MFLHSLDQGRFRSDHRSKDRTSEGKRTSTSGIPWAVLVLHTYDFLFCFVLRLRSCIVMIQSAS